MAEAISLDDLLTAYREAGFTGDAGDGGATREELRQVWKCGAVKASQYLRMAQQAGILQTGWRISKDISGRNNRIPVYSFTSPPKARKKGRPA